MLSSTQRQSLLGLLARPEIQALGQDYPAIAAAINDRPLVANPEPRSEVQRIYRLTEILALIQPAEMTAILGAGSATYTDWAAARLQDPAFTQDAALITVVGYLASQGATGQKTLLEILTVVVSTQSRALLLAKVAVLKAAGLIGAQSETAISAYANETFPDPAWPEEILGESLGQSVGLPVITEFDVQEADLWP